ncbi:hypothetical protein YC2023_089758 [Brassica napus]
MSRVVLAQIIIWSIGLRDCGSGIRRITKNLLIWYSNEVNMFLRFLQLLGLQSLLQLLKCMMSYGFIGASGISCYCCLKPGGDFGVKETLAQQGKLFFLTFQDDIDIGDDDDHQQQEQKKPN